MKKSVKMADVAAAAGVSPMTVSRAFRSDASVGGATRARILRIADDMGYVFDSTASNLRSQRTGFVATTIPSLNNANFADTVRGLTETLADHDLQVLLGYTDYNTATEERLVEQLLRRRPDAIVVTGGTHTARTRMLLGAAGVPVVEMWDLPDDPIDYVVGFSNAEAMRLMVAHLFARGRRRFAFIGGEDRGDTRGADRRRGFLSAVGKTGLAPPFLISAGSVPVTMQEGATAMARLLSAHPETDAVVCVSDLSAFGALVEAQRQGRVVPRDIAVAGFGGFEISAVCTPRITTVDARSHEIGAEVGRLLGHVLAGKAAPARRIELEPRLLVRESA